MSARNLVMACAIAAVVGLGLPETLEAGQNPQGLVPAPSSYKVKDVDIDLSVPESPAFTALGLNPEEIVRPATPREFATSLLNGVDRKGNLQTGVAFDTVPYLVFWGSEVTLANYRKSAMTRVLSRTSFSVATTKGGGEEDKSVKLAFGVHATLFDTEDPRVNNDDLLKCFALIAPFRPAAVPIDGNTANLEAERKKFEGGMRTQAAACREQFRREARWNATSWIVAAAHASVSATGLAGDLMGGATTAWSSFSYGFDGVPGLSDHAQLIGHVRHINGDIVVDKDLPSGQEIRDTSTAGGQFRVGTSSFAVAFEAAYQKTVAAGRPDDVAMRLSVSAERRLAKDLWLTVAFGGDRGADAANTNGMSLLTAFKWGFAKEPSLVSQ